MNLKSSLRDVFAAGLLVVCATAVAQAQEPLQDWIPEVLTMPEDAELVSERAIGSTLRMLSISTNADVDALFEEWGDSLRTNGYVVDRGEAELLERSIEFSGEGIVNAKIIVSPAEQDGRSVLEFDATLD